MTHFSAPSRTFRVVMAGDASVGKSSLIMRIVKNQYVKDLPTTLGVDFHVKVMQIDGTCVAMQLWDTAGQERFRSLTKSYFRRADGAILVYDITNESSFMNVREWIDIIKDSTLRNIPVYVCGNKVDKRVECAAANQKCISHEDGQKLASVYNALFMETSARCGDCVDQVAENIVRYGVATDITGRPINYSEMLAHEDEEMNAAGVVLKPVGDGKTDRNCYGVRKKACTT